MSVENYRIRGQLYSVEISNDYKKYEYRHVLQPVQRINHQVLD